MALQWKIAYNAYRRWPMAIRPHTLRADVQSSHHEVHKTSRPNERKQEHMADAYIVSSGNQCSTPEPACIRTPSMHILVASWRCTCIFKTNRNDVQWMHITMHNTSTRIVLYLVWWSKTISLAPDPGLPILWYYHRNTNLCYNRWCVNSEHEILWNTVDVVLLNTAHSTHHMIR